MAWRTAAEKAQRDPVSFHAGQLMPGLVFLFAGGVLGLMAGARLPLAVIGMSLGAAGFVELYSMGLVGSALRGPRPGTSSTYADPRFGRLAGVATWLCFAALTLVGMVPADQLIPSGVRGLAGYLAGDLVQFGMWWSLMAAGAMGVRRVRRGCLDPGTAAAQFGLLAWALVTVAGIEVALSGAGFGVIMVVAGGAMLAWHESALRRAGEAAAIGAHVPGAPAVGWSRRRSIADLVGLIVVVALLGALSVPIRVSGANIFFDTSAAPSSVGIWSFVLFGLIVGALVFAGLKPGEAATGEGQTA